MLDLVHRFDPAAQSFGLGKIRGGGRRGDRVGESRFEGVPPFIWPPLKVYDWGGEKSQGN